MVNDLIKPTNKIKVYWDDVPENYSKGSENKIQAYFSKKYKLPKNNVKVVYRPIKRDENGNVVEMTDAGVDNIMDVNYQRELMKQWLKNNDVKVELDRLFRLDDKVNKDLDFGVNESRHRRWDVKALWINNFLCFGRDNHVNFENLKGLNVVNSIPENTGGKTTFNVDTFKFLLFGKTTKTEKNEDIFNTYSDDDMLVVRGLFNFYPDDIIIERKLTRKEKRGGGYTVSNKVKYYRLLPDGSEDELDEEDATQTTKKIGECIGKESDFDITTLATANNLETLIETKPTENGKLLNRFIGLEIIDDKLVAARKMYNDFNKTKVGNLYNVITLRDEIDELNDKKDVLEALLETHGEKLKETEKELLKLNDEKDTLLSKKVTVDESLININTDTINQELEDVKLRGVSLKKQKAEFEKEIEAIGVVEFDEDEHDQLTTHKNSNERDIRNLEQDITNLNKTNENLANSENCHACHRPLEGVDNSGEIKKNTELISEKQELIKEFKTEIESISEKLENLNKVKKDVDKRNQLELNRDKVDVELGSLRNEYTQLNTRIKNYNTNKDAIDNNREIDTQVSNVKTKIKVAETTKEAIHEKSNNIKVEIGTIENNIATKEGYVKKIKGEEVVERIFKIYIEMVGKKGISKMVLRSVLPIINSELVRLMDDICDFTIELNINEKNDVEYLLVRDGVTKSLKSGSGLEKTIASIALRAVLGKMAYLPMPNFITFDEVLGKVANDNIEKMQSIFDKIKELYDMVFLITHNDVVKDWADRIITVKKTNNISELNIK
jgi:DNA repair exonuclease SbcCD ATPase subunit